MDYKKRCVNKYEDSIGTIKSYADSLYRVCCFPVLRKKGIDEDRKFTAKGEAGNADKLTSNIVRAKSKLFELAFCNQWELFVTLTLDKTKYNRYDLNKFIKDLSQFIRDYKKKHNTDIKYLLIPEQHKDGAWHMHGFIKGLPIEQLTPFDQNERLPIKILNRLSQGKKVYFWKPYSQKFGFSDIEIIENLKAVSKYITKYVTKDITTAVKELNAHIYYASQGLQRANIIYRGRLAVGVNEIPKERAFGFVFENEYVSVFEYTDLEKAFSIFSPDE